MKHDTLLSFLNYLRRKDPIGGSISSQEYNVLAPIVAFKYFKKIMGLPDQYQKGARDPINGYGLNTISEEKIRPLKVLPATISVDSLGYADYPADYFRKSACFYNYMEGSVTRRINVTWGNDASFAERAATVMDPPTLTTPIANLHSTKIRFLPTDYTGIIMKLEYIKYPTAPVRGYVIDYNTAEDVYVDKGAYCQVVTSGSSGNVIILSSGDYTLGSYMVIEGDTVEDVMIGLTSSINQNTLYHSIRAVYDGEKVVLIDNILRSYGVLISSVTGGLSINKSNFTAWSVEFDWENDIEAMTDISEIMLDMMGISNRDMNVVQWAEKEKTS